MKSKILNTNKLAKEVDKSPLSKVQLAERCGISRVTLDSILKGKEIGLHKFLKLVNALDKNIGYYFDEDIEIREAGRDYVEQGTIEHNGTEYNGSSATEEDLREYISLLKSQLADKERIIKLLEERK